LENWLNRYIDVLQNLTVVNISQLRQVTSVDIVFRDPFNETYCQDDFIAIMEEMFCALSDVQFNVTHSMQKESEAVIYWTFSARYRSRPPFSFEGCSRLLSDASGQITMHLDYWDGTALIEQLPFIGMITKKIKNRITYKTD
jgi:hypothetical protein